MIPQVTLSYQGEAKYTADEIADVVGRGGSDFQGRFFNNLGLIFKSFGESDKDGMQMLFIRDELTRDGKEFIKKLAKYIESEDV